MMANTIPYFITQDYPTDRRELIILDDAGELKNETGDGWQIMSISRRFRSLPEKFNALAGVAQGDILIVWKTPPADSTPASRSGGHWSQVGTAISSPAFPVFWRSALSSTKSDINEHCDKRRELAAQAESVVEFRMPHGVWTVALLPGSAWNVRGVFVAYQSSTKSRMSLFVQPTAPGRRQYRQGLQPCVCGGVVPQVPSVRICRSRQSALVA
jgi:hypothetical protein